MFDNAHLLRSLLHMHSTAEEEQKTQPAPSDEPDSSNDPNDVTLADDAYHFPEYAEDPHRMWYTEWWYFNFYEPKTKIGGMATFAIFNPGSHYLPGVSSITAAIITPDKITPVIEYHSIDKFQGSTETADLTLAGSTLSVQDAQTYAINVHSADQNVKINLTYTQADKPQFFIRNQHGSYWNVSSWLNYMPSAWVDGTVTLNGQEYPIVKAAGYHDHDWGMWLVFKETWDWAEVAIPEQEITFDAVFHAAFQKSTSYFRYGDLRVYFDQDTFDPQPSDWVTWKGLWKYPTSVTFEAQDATRTYMVKMAWKVLDTLALWQYPLIVFEQTAHFEGALYQKDDSGAWQIVCEVDYVGFSEHSTQWL